MSQEDYDSIVGLGDTFEKLADSYWDNPDIAMAYVDAATMAAAYTRCMNKEGGGGSECAELAAYSLFFPAETLCPEKLDVFKNCSKGSKEPLTDCATQLEAMRQHVVDVFNAEPSEKLSQPESAQLKECLKTGSILSCGLNFCPTQKQTLDDCLKKVGIGECKDEIDLALKCVGPVLRKGQIEL